MIHETSENKVMLEFLNLLAVQESVSCKKYEHCKVTMQYVGRDCATGGAWGEGQEPPQKFTEPPVGT